MALPVTVERGHAFDPFDILRNDLNMLGRFLGFSEAGDGGTLLASLSNYGVDIREDADHIYVEADLPGFRKEDVNISLENGTLTIIAEHEEEVTEPPQQQGTQSPQQQQDQQGTGRSQQQQQTSNYLLRERRSTRFVRSFNLPPNVDESHVQATLENGVLKITLNKREESKPRRVQLS